MLSAGSSSTADWRKQICLAEQRVVARQPLRGPRQAMAVDVEQRELFESFRIGVVDEEAGAHAGLEMAGGEVVTVEPDDPLRRTAPGETVGQTVDEPVVEGEHEGRVDRMRRGDSRGVGRIAPVLRLLIGHGETI